MAASSDAGPEVTTDPAPLVEPDGGPAAPVPVVMPAALTTRPAVAGARASIEVRGQAVLGALTVKFASHGHKHRMGRARSLGMYQFELTRSGKLLAVELRSDEDGFQAEVTAHGALFVFEHKSYDQFEVALVAARAPREQTEDECVARIDAAAAGAGLPLGEARGYGTEYGILTVSEPTWRGHCGRYTKRVWFSAREPRMSGALDDGAEL